MERYGKFQRLAGDLLLKSEHQQLAMRHYRSHFLWDARSKVVVVHGHQSHVEYLAAFGVLNPDSKEDNTYSIASPLMDSFVRHMIIRRAFPDTPTFPPPKRFASALSFKTAHINVNGHRGQPVPRVNVYNSEMTRILALELVATEIQKQVEGLEAHVNSALEYKGHNEAREGQVIHSTRQDNYLQDTWWPAQEDFNNGIKVVHMWHDQSLFI
ncbi:MAG: hypothetical protein J3R72DRAFT_426998 [Linnemannia gamsii]|nr:MAG: hypothetical protein J3R72DRAFT_426998 [Linnemannia gamsii]